jgi:hypothetical protein
MTKIVSTYRGYISNDLLVWYWKMSEFETTQEGRITELDQILLMETI